MVPFNLVGYSSPEDSDPQGNEKMTMSEQNMQSKECKFLGEEEVVRKIDDTHEGAELSTFVIEFSSQKNSIVWILFFCVYKCISKTYNL